MAEQRKPFTDEQILRHYTTSFNEIRPHEREWIEDEVYADILRYRDLADTIKDANSNHIIAGQVMHHLANLLDLSQRFFNRQTDVKGELNSLRTAQGIQALLRILELSHSQQLSYYAARPIKGDLIQVSVQRNVLTDILQQTSFVWNYDPSQDHPALILNWRVQPEREVQLPLPVLSAHLALFPQGQDAINSSVKVYKSYNMVNAEGKTLINCRPDLEEHLHTQVFDSRSANRYLYSSSSQADQLRAFIEAYNIPLPC